MVGTITIHAGAEFRTSFANIYQEDEFLYPEYCQAARCIDEIVSASIQYDQANNSSLQNHRSMGYGYHPAGTTGFDPTNEQLLRGYPNNIVAFCARRGQGKTSCMLSVSKALSLLPVQSWDQYEDTNKITQFWMKAHRRTDWTAADPSLRTDTSSGPVSGLRFFVIDPIDPSSMEHGDSLLRTIFLRMEQAVKKHLSDRRDESSHDLRQLRDQFGKTFRKLLALKQSPNMNSNELYDDLTQLEQSGDSVILRKSMMELFKSFLDFMGYDMLVIQIDDADLNSARAFEITEDIRNYCVGPHVIVLMALHLGTLRNCIEQEYVKRYEYLLRQDLAITHMERDKCRETAERYIDKFLPSRHQIHMPYLKDFLRDGVSNVGLRYLSPSVPHGKRDAVDIYPRCDLQAFMMNLVYRKTGVILMPRKDYYHAFMPSRFRELTHMLSFFSELEDVIPHDENNNLKPDVMLQKVLISYACYDPKSEQTEYDPDQIQYLDRRIHNLKQIELYLIQHWASTTLNKQQWQILHDISEVPDSILFRKAMIRLERYLCINTIANIFPAELYPGFEEGRSLPEFSRLSLGIVKKTLRTIDWDLDFEDKYAFTYSLRLLFSIRLQLNALNQLRYHKSLDSLAKMCEDKIFYVDPLNLDGKQLISVALLRHMKPSFEAVNLGWTDYYEALSSIDGHGVILQESTVTDTGNNRWQINPKAAWLRPSFNHTLFRSISDEVMKEQRKADYQSGSKIAFNGASDLLMLICNYDMQHRLSCSLSKQTAVKSSIYYGESVLILADHMNELFSTDRTSREPQQHLPLGRNYSDALLWGYSNKNNTPHSQIITEGKLSIALELANPVVCVSKVRQLLEELLKDLEKKNDPESYQKLMEEYPQESLDIVNYLKKIPALSRLMELILEMITSARDSKTVDDQSKLEMYQDQIQMYLSAINDISKSVGSKAPADAARDLEKELLNADLFSSINNRPKNSPKNSPRKTKKRR